MSTVYYAKVKLYSSLVGWQFPQITRSSESIDELREDINDSLVHIYEKVAIFLGDELIEEIQ